MPSERIKCVWDFLQILFNEDCISEEQKRGLLYDITKPQIDALTEIFFNLLHANLPLKEEISKKINKHRRILKSLSKKSLPLFKKRKLIRKHYKIILFFMKSLKSILKQLIK